MVQDKELRIGRCPSQQVRLNLPSGSKLSSPACNNKYSTLNFVASRSQPARECNRELPRIVSQTQNQNRSCWDKCTASSCLVGFMKFIQHQCQPLSKKKRTFMIIHDDVLAAMKQLKCDLDSIADIERQNADKLTIPKNGDNPKKILTRMACKIYEIEDRLMKSNVITCNEMLAKRRFMLAFIKNIQKAVCDYLEGESLAMRNKQNKLCNLLKCLKCIENEFRFMSKGMKTQCCPTICDKAVCRVKSNRALNKLPKKKSCILPSTISASKIGKEYELQGVDLVYTKSTIKSLDPGKNVDECNCGDIKEEECIDKKVACYVPACGEPICEVKVRAGNETLELCDSKPINDVICQMSTVWQESARQLINAFHSC